MTNKLSFVTANELYRDSYASSQSQERALNAAIIRANISESYEEYLEIFDAFYADDIDISSEAHEEPLRGKPTVRSLLFNFLAPLHAMAEVGGLLISIRETPICGDTADETHSEWTLDLVGVTGKTCTLSWRALRKWKGSHIVYEHHYDQQQIGGPLTFNDLSFNAVKPALGAQQPS